MTRSKLYHQALTSWSDPTWQAAAHHTYSLAHEALMQLPTADMARAWLDARGIGPRAWIAYQLGYAEVVTLPGGEQIAAQAITIPWIIGGRVRAIRFLLLEPQGERTQILLPGSSVSGVLFGGHVLGNDNHPQKTLLVIEGELNALCVYLVAGMTNLDVLAIDSQTGSLPVSFYLHAAKYKQVIFWLSTPVVLKEASQQLASAYQVHGAGKPTALELHCTNRLGEVLARIRCKVATKRLSSLDTHSIWDNFDRVDF